MAQVQELARRGWQRYRGLPTWAQIAIGIVVLSVIVGPFLDNEKTKKSSAAPSSSTQRREPTTRKPIAQTTVLRERETTTHCTSARCLVETEMTAILRPDPLRIATSLWAPKGPR